MNNLSELPADLLNIIIKLCDYNCICPMLYTNSYLYNFVKNTYKYKNISYVKKLKYYLHNLHKLRCYTHEYNFKDLISVDENKICVDVGFKYYIYIPKHGLGPRSYNKYPSGIRTQNVDNNYTYIKTYGILNYYYTIYNKYECLGKYTIESDLFDLIAIDYKFGFCFYDWYNNKLVCKNFKGECLCELLINQSKKVYYKHPYVVMLYTNMILVYNIQTKDFGKIICDTTISNLHIVKDCLYVTTDNYFVIYCLIDKCLVYKIRTNHIILRQNKYTGIYDKKEKKLYILN
jgi:hypothetical protein